MRTLITVLALLLATRTASGQVDDTAEELAAKRTQVRRLKLATGVTLGLGAPMVAAALITGTAGFGKAMEGLGCALGSAFGDGPTPGGCGSGREADRLLGASMGLGVIGGATLLAGIGVAIAYSVEKKRLERMESESHDEQLEHRRRQLRDEEKYRQWQLDGVSLAPILRGDRAEGAIAQLSLRF